MTQLGIDPSLNIYFLMKVTQKLEDWVQISSYVLKDLRSLRAHVCIECI